MWPVTSAPQSSRSPSVGRGNPTRTVIVREAINGYWDLNHVVTDRTVTEYRFYNLWHQNPRADDQAKIDGEVDQYSGGSAGTLLRADATQPPSTMIPVPDCSATQPS